eukprot:TRINITY_DN66000_c0_g1_i1.p1 TRINITY_DN66000_c0_g1~~TRINITY_DN66000_c0_g1_i1.p1  ORF type:complete len:238 (+),score=65.52 TRINITY_DN66000_c0_g1_i1:102-815(+)
MSLACVLGSNLNGLKRGGAKLRRNQSCPALRAAATTALGLGGPGLKECPGARRPPLEPSAGSKHSLRQLESELLRGPDDGPLTAIAESPLQSPMPRDDWEGPSAKTGSGRLSQEQTESDDDDDGDETAGHFLDPEERLHLEEMKAQELQRMEEMEAEELRRVEEMEARVEEQLQAALAELQASMQRDDFTTLDDATQGLVRQLGPRVKQHEARRQERLTSWSRTAKKPRGVKLPSVR